MSTSFWDFAVTPWNVSAAVVILAAAIALAVISLRRHQERSSRYRWIEALRMLIVLLFVVTLFRPERVYVSRKTERPKVAILADASDSMQTADVVVPNQDAISRADWLQAQFDRDAWAPLTTRYDVLTTRFSRPPAETNTTADSDAPWGTDINRAIEDALRRTDDLRAIVLLTDGDWNEGVSPITAATRLRLESRPLFAVAVGADRFLPDLDLQSVRAPSYGLMDENVFVPFTIQSRLDRDVQTSINLRGTDGTLLQKPIRIPANGQLQDSVVLQPRRRGTFQYTLELPAEREEIQVANNAHRFEMSFRRELLTVLVVDSAPRWEYRYLRNALSRDPGVRVHCLLLHPQLGPGGGDEYLDRFPADRDALSKYDVIFLGDVGIGQNELSTEDAGLIRGLVEQQGSGLVFLPGTRGRQLTLKDTPLWDIMPVVPNTKNSQGLGFQIESKLNLTTTGRDHLLTLLAEDPSANWARWRSLPGFYWHAAVEKARAGSDVLAVHESVRSRHGRMPLLVSRNAGNGKTLFMGTDSAWRWRRGVEDTYHYRFWGQVVRWMAHQRHLAYQEGIRFFYSPERPRRGDELTLHATVLDGSGYPLNDAEVIATVRSPSGQTRELVMRPEDGDWGVYTATTTPSRGGDIEITISCESVQRSVSATVSVESRRREQVGRPAKVALLREMATVTQGAFSDTDGLDTLLERVMVLPEATPHEQRLRLWAHPLWAALLILLMGLQWVGRKLLGMI